MPQPNPAVSLPPSHQGEKFPVEILSAEEARALVRAPSSRAPTGVRNKALIVVMLRAGLRLAEALALKPSDLDARACEIRVLRGKGSKARTVAIDEGAMAIVQRWVDLRRELGLRGGPLFCTLRGEPLGPRYVRAMLQRMAARAGIDKRVHPHGLRHTHAAELAREGLPMNAIQAQLGHSSLATTSVYLSHISPGELSARIKRRTWEL
jgi:site-specific recombinase XerD